MSDLTLALREMFGSEPFTALDALTKVPRERLPVSTGYVIARHERGGKDMAARSLGQLLSHVAEVEAVGYAHGGKRLWRMLPVL